MLKPSISYFSPLVLAGCSSPAFWFCALSSRVETAPKSSQVKSHHPFISFHWGGLSCWLGIERLLLACHIKPLSTLSTLSSLPPSSCLLLCPFWHQVPLSIAILISSLYPPGTCRQRVDILIVVQLRLRLNAQRLGRLGDHALVSRGPSPVSLLLPTLV